jgi:hypothetical protein
MPGSSGYTVDDGYWLFQVCVPAHSAAVVVASQKDYAVVVDNTPPVASLVTGQFNAPQPPEVTLQFKGKDFPDGSPSGIAVFQCMLAREGDSSSSGSSMPAAPSSSNSSSNRNSDVVISGQPATTRIVQLNDSSPAAAPTSSVPAGAGKKLLSWQADLDDGVAADYALVIPGSRRRLMARPTELGFKNGATVPLANYLGQLHGW